MDEYIKHMNKACMRFSKKFNKRLKPAIVALAKAIAKGAGEKEKSDG